VGRLADVPLAPSGLPADLAEVSGKRCLVMGVLNVTPDSFSDGGLHLDPVAAVAHGVGMRDQGADLVDVGGESTRPGAQRVPVEEELRRVLPVVARLAEAGVVVSIDTTRAVVAEQALAAGASVVNDVSGGLADPDIRRVVAAARVPYVLMHWRAHAVDMSRYATYDDVVADVAKELSQRLDEALDVGVDVGQIVLDPGLGFAKEAEHNWELLRRLDEIIAIGRPVLVGTSRKRFLGALLADAATGEPRPVAERDDATTATSALAAAAGVWCVRVHQVRATRDAVAVVAAWHGTAS
jgi:dihydropteroate synthase